MAVNFPLISFLCLSGALLTAGAPVTNDQGCPDGWTPFGTRCFKFFDSKSTWTEAEKSCQSHGANLASIHSAEENTFVANLIKKATGERRRTLIGGQDAVKEHEWMWSDGSVWDFSSWASGQPDNWEGKEHVVELDWKEQITCKLLQGTRIYAMSASLDTFWNDVPEDTAGDYICAKDAAPSPCP